MHTSTILLFLLAALIGLQCGAGHAASKSIKKPGTDRKQTHDDAKPKKLKSKPPRTRAKPATPPGVPVPYPNTGGAVTRKKQGN